jgi:hypothetical protein
MGEESQLAAEAQVCVEILRRTSSVRLRMTGAGAVSKSTAEAEKKRGGKPPFAALRVNRTPKSFSNSYSGQNYEKQENQPGTSVERI